MSTIHRHETEVPANSQRRIVRADAHLRAEAEDILRDIAFVLKMTQRVKSEILANKPKMEMVAI